MDHKEFLPSNRHASLDLLKIIAMYMIVIWHFYIHGMQVDNTFKFVWNAPAIFNLVMSQFVLIVCSVCVNVYVLITGYFLICKGFKLYRILRVWSEAFFYGLVLSVFVSIFFPSSFSKEELLNTLFPIHSNSYWFVRQYIGLLILSPFLSMAANSMQKKTFELLLVVLMIIGTTFIMGYPLGNAMRFMKGYSLAWFACLFLFGSYFRRFGFPMKSITSIRLYCIASISLLLFSIIKILVNANINGAPLIIIEYNYNGFPFFLSLFLFCWFGQIRITNFHVVKALACIAPLVFGVYLIHDHLLIREILWYKTISWTKLYYSYMLIPIMCMVTMSIFILCIIMEYFRKQLFGLLRLEQRISIYSEKVESALRTEIEKFDK